MEFFKEILISLLPCLLCFGLVFGILLLREISTISSCVEITGSHIHESCHWKVILLLILFLASILFIAFGITYLSRRCEYCKCCFECIEKKRNEVRTRQTIQLYEDQNQSDNIPPSAPSAPSAPFAPTVGAPRFPVFPSAHNAPSAPSIVQNQNLAYVDDEQPPSHEQPPSFLGEENSLGLSYLRWSHEVLMSEQPPPSAPFYEQLPCVFSIHL